MRPIHTSAFSSHGSRTHAVTDTYYRILAHGDIRPLSDIPPDNWEDPPPHTHNYSDDIYHRDSHDREEEVVL